MKYEESKNCYSLDECRRQFCLKIITISRFWINENLETKATEEGICHSILSLLDGKTIGFPKIELRISPHEDDKQDAIDRGEKWYQDGMIINEPSMKEDFFKLASLGTNFGPINEKLGHHLSSQFMFMATYNIEGKQIHTYKHQKTRRYLNLDEDLVVYKYTKGTYLKISDKEALDAVYS